MLARFWYFFVHFSKFALPFDHVFLVLHKSRFSQLSSDLPHSLFQLNGF